MNECKHGGCNLQIIHAVIVVVLYVPFACINHQIVDVKIKYN